jgi:hypothetical protein
VSEAVTSIVMERVWRVRWALCLFLVVGLLGASSEDAKAQQEPLARPIEIVSVLFRGQRPDGSVVFGIVHDFGNDMVPRSPEERWLRQDTRSRLVVSGTGGRKADVCDTPEIAKRIVAAIPAIPDGERGTRVTRLIAVWDKTLQNEDGCSPVEGFQYRVVAIHEKVLISLGPDAREEWTALSVTDSVGRMFGMLYDSGAP